jgi:hypothetical protein
MWWSDARHAPAGWLGAKAGFAVKFEKPFDAVRGFRRDSASAEFTRSG